ncbi:RING-finger-containing E3 ubiquitin ligase [Heliothis virescens ascovirus 3i]|nr:RING-finger-containing E3 ubiquitin ligase [Heliothis virescens ascovirus 3i]
MWRAQPAIRTETNRYIFYKNSPSPIGAVDVIYDKLSGKMHVNLNQITSRILGRIDVNLVDDPCYTIENRFSRCTLSLIANNEHHIPVVYEAESCRHSFCATCFHAWIDIDKRCPDCGLAVYNYFVKRSDGHIERVTSKWGEMRALNADDLSDVERREYTQ